MYRGSGNKEQVHDENLWEIYKLKGKGYTKQLDPGSWRDNLPDPFHTAKEVDALFNNIELERKQEKEAKKSKK